MKRITLWFLATVSVVALLFGYDASTAATTRPSPPAASTVGKETDSSQVTGGVADTRSGPVQETRAVQGSDRHR